MRKIKLTQGKYALVDDEYFEKISKYAWQAEKNRNTWYARGWVNKKTIKLHRLILDVCSEFQIDHINGNGLDNRKKNLRVCTHRQNHMSRGSRKSKSKYKGISWYKRDKRWMSSIRYFGRPIHLGVYKTEKEAAYAYDFGALMLFGDYARTNFVGPNPTATRSKKC